MPDDLSSTLTLTSGKWLHCTELQGAHNFSESDLKGLRDCNNAWRVGGTPWPPAFISAIVCVCPLALMSWKLKPRSLVGMILGDGTLGR